MRSNHEKKIKKEIGAFLQQYKRKKDRHIDPNDRQYDRNIGNTAIIEGR